MFALNKIARCAAVGTIVVLGGFSLPARAEPAQRLVVGPNDTIFATVGSKGVFAFYEPDGTHCYLHVVVYSRADESGASAAGVRVSENVMKLDSAECN